MSHIEYKAGYKYQLVTDYSTRLVFVFPAAPIELAGVATLDPQGNIRISAGYAWDGPSGPTVDTPDFMRGSLVHDVLYQLMRHELLPHSAKDLADRELRRLCLEDGMSRFRAWYVYWGVRLFADSATRPSDRHQVIYAP